MKNIPRVEQLVWRILLAALAVFLALPATAREPEPAAPENPSRSAYRVETSGQGTFGGERVRYRAIVAETFILNDKGKRAASIVSTSYVRADAPKGSPRPVVFVFNGGPGSAGLWLQMGLMGPRRVGVGIQAGMRWKQIASPSGVACPLMSPANRSGCYKTC